MKILKKFKALFDPIDLTKGSILKDLAIFIVPILLSMVFQQVYTLTDAIIVGHNLGPNQIAGLNDANAATGLTLQFAIGCTSGLSVVISHRIGESNFSDARKSFLLQILLCLGFTIVLTVTFCLLVDPILSLMKINPGSDGSAKQELYLAAHDYLFIIFLGTIAQMGYNMVSANLRALGDSFVPFLFLVLGTALNVLLDYLFIVPFEWGVAGSAWATNLSTLLAAVGCYIYAFIKYPFLRYQKGVFKCTMPFVFEHLKLGLPLAFQSMILQVGIIIMQMSIVSFDIDLNGLTVIGQPATVGYSVANKLNYILMNAYSAFGTAMLTFHGQNYGAMDFNRIKKGFKLSLLIGTIAWVIMSAIGLLLTINGAYCHIFLSRENITDEVIRYGNAYLYVAIPCDLILMFLFLFRNSLQGLDQPLFPFLAGIGELLARTLLCLFLPAAINGGAIDSTASMASYVGVCLADPLAWTCAVIIMLPIFKVVFKNKNDRTEPIISQ